MPFTARVVVITAFSIALASMSLVQAYAVPSSLQNFDYRRRDLSVRIIEETSTHTIQPSSASGSKLNKRDDDFLSQMGLFNNYYKQVYTNSDNLRTQNYSVPRACR